MSGTLAWYMARAGGLIAWALLTASVVWGLALRTKVTGTRPRPAWVLDLHRFLGAAAVVFAAIHVLTLLADSYTDLGLLEVVVPFTSSWRPVAVACGVVALDLLLAVEITSLLRRRLSLTVWRRVHLASFVLFIVTTVHAFTAGTDRVVVLIIGSLTVAAVGALFGVRLSTPRGRRVRARPAQTRPPVSSGACR